MQAIYRYILAPCTNIYFSAYFPLLYQNSLIPIALIAPNEVSCFQIIDNQAVNILAAQKTPILFTCK